jgi:hypothetical protein
MNGTKTLRGLGGKTRRITGRRSVTPIKPRRKRILKTRYRKRVENGVSIQQHAGSRGDGEWREEDEEEYCRDSEWKRNKDGGTDRKWKDTQEHKETVKCGNTENPAKSVYPGSLQELHELSELAVADITNETDLQEEEDL